MTTPSRHRFAQDHDLGIVYGRVSPADGPRLADAYLERRLDHDRRAGHLPTVLEQQLAHDRGPDHEAVEEEHHVRRVGEVRRERLRVGRLAPQVHLAQGVRRVVQREGHQVALLDPGAPDEQKIRMRHRRDFAEDRMVAIIDVARCGSLIATLAMTSILLAATRLVSGQQWDGRFIGH